MNLNATAACQYCGMIHGPTCFMVKAMEFYEDGSVKRVEFKTASDYQQLPVLPLPGYGCTTVRQ